MPTKIITELNQVVEDFWFAIDANANSFLAVQIAQNLSGAELYGIDYGILIAGAAGDETTLRAECYLFENPAFNANQAAGFQRGSALRFADATYPLARTRIHNFTTPIKISSGRGFGVVMFTRQVNGPIAGVSHVFLNVRGELQSAQGKSPRPRKVGV